MSQPSWRSVLRWPAIRPETAQLAGWGMVAAVSLASTASVRSPPGGLRTAALRDAFVVGQLVAAGVVAYGGVALYRRFGPRGRLAAYAAVAAAALAVGVPVLDEDTATAAGKLGLPYAVSHALLVVAMSAVVPLAAFVGGLLARPWARSLGVAAAIGGAVATWLALPGNDYPGVHLVGAWASATLFGAAVATPGAPAGGRSRAVALGALALFGAWAVAVRPSGRVVLAIYSVPGAVVEPWIERVRQHDRDDAEASPSDGEGFPSRVGHPPIAPSTPPLVPQNAIVILLTVDCLRADLLAGDAHEAELPSMTALRRGAVQFTEARATSSATSQSISAIFSGLYYSQLYWAAMPGASADAVYPHDDPAPRFPEILSRGGVNTATFTGLSGLRNKWGLVRGIRQERVLPAPRGATATAEQIMEPAILRLRLQNQRSLFMYIHVADAHEPYDHGRSEGAPFARYMRGLGRVDLELGKLLAALDADPALGARTTIFLSADHGEAFGEHGVYHHATTLYDEMLRVPLLVRVPGVAPRVVAQPVSIIDLAPTILDLFGQPTPGELMGESLVPFLRGEDPVLARPIVADSSRLARAMIFPDGFKVIDDRRRGTTELFDLSHDPAEMHDVFDAAGHDAHLGALRAFFRTHTLRRPGYKVPYGR